MRALLALAMAALACSLLTAGEGNYVKKWIWEKDELKKIAEMEKKVAFKDGYFVYETDNFIVKTELGERFTAEAALFMEIFHAVFLEVFNFKTGSEVDIKPTLVIFKSAERYAQVGIGGSRGVFTWRQAGEKVEFALYTYMKEDRLCNFSNCYHPVIQHEGTHCLVQKLVGTKPVPAWLTEGMATFYEYWDYRSKASPSGNKPKDAEARKKRLTLSERKHYLRDGVRESGGQYPTLKYLLSLNTLRQWDVDGMGPRTGLHYAMAESFADFLISDKKGRDYLRLIFERLVKGEKELLQDKEIEELEPRWHKHLREVWGINAKGQ
ncbi:MAG: hypothetical protein N3A66_03035 [Planctomycetota bacterium]|nr:hypothetical protein [Planctomycetota bacterium]